MVSQDSLQNPSQTPRHLISPVFPKLQYRRSESRPSIPEEVIVPILMVYIKRPFLLQYLQKHVFVIGFARAEKLLIYYYSVCYTSL